MDNSRMDNGRIEGAGLVMMLTFAVAVVFTALFAAVLVIGRISAPAAPVLAQDASPLASPAPAYAVISPTHTPPEWDALAGQHGFAHEPTAPAIEFTAENGFAAR